MFDQLKLRGTVPDGGAGTPSPAARAAAQQRTLGPRIVIVGGGAGGVELATRLGDRFEKQRAQYKEGTRPRLVLVDRLPTHVWKPLLHEVAAGSLDANTQQLEYVAQARWHHFEFQQGELTGLDRARKTITVSAVSDEEGVEILPQRELPYDTLVLAIGSITNFFQTKGASEHALAIDTVHQAEHFRRRLIACCMRAQNRIGDAAREIPRRSQVNIVIIGGGATGVELSAELRNTAYVLAAYGLHHLDPRRDVRITIVESGARLLGPLPERVAQETADTLRELGITIRTGERVTEVRDDEVLTASGKRMPADLTVWAAGIRVPPVLGDLGLTVNKLGQVIVTQSLQTGDDPSIFAFGDCASCPWPQGGEGRTVPPRAQAAHQQAQYLYRALQRHLRGKPAGRFTYHDRGSLISLGRFNAVGNLMGKIVGKSMLVEGSLARLLYFSLHRAHQVALHGILRMLLDTLAEWARRKNAPRVKLH